MQVPALFTSRSMPGRAARGVEEEALGGLDRMRREIALHDRHLHAQRGAHRLRLFGRRVAAQAVQHDVRAGPGEGHGDGPADSLRGTGDEGAMSLER